MVEEDPSSLFPFLPDKDRRRPLTTGDPLDIRSERICRFSLIFMEMIWSFVLRRVGGSLAQRLRNSKYNSPKPILRSYPLISRVAR